MKKVIKKLRPALVISMITVSTLLMAQEPPNPEEDPNSGVNDSQVPFDGGVSLLVAAGLGYGLKKVYDKEKSRQIIKDN